MKKCLGLAMLIIGAILGAGFASGREIIAFWGYNPSFLVAPAVAVCFFLLSVMFLSIGSRLKKSTASEVNAVFLGKFHILADIFLLLNSLVLLAGMLSAMDTVLGLLFPLAPLYSILSAILCAAIVSKGLRAILKCNAIIVPLIVVILVFICMQNISDVRNQIAFSSFSVGATIIYVSMNMMLACSFFVTISELKKSTIIIGSAIASIVLGGIILLLIFAIRNNNVQNAPMPILELAKQIDISVFYISVVIISLSIFTTMLTSMGSLKLWVQGFGCSDLYSTVIVSIAGLIVSNLGFENVVGYLYPLIGVVGLFYIAISLVYLLRERLREGTYQLKGQRMERGIKPL